jgi:hypothetical protein
MPYPSLPCGLAAFETAIQPFHGWPVFHLFTHAVHLWHLTRKSDWQPWYKIYKMNQFVDCEGVLARPGHRNTFFNVNYEDKIFQIVAKNGIILLIRWSRSFWFPSGCTIGVWEEVAMESLKFHPGLLYPLMPCGSATPERALWSLWGWPPHRAASLQPSSILLDTSRCTPMVSAPFYLTPSHINDKHEFNFLIILGPRKL